MYRNGERKEAVKMMWKLVGKLVYGAGWLAGAVVGGFAVYLLANALGLW